MKTDSGAKTDPGTPEPGELGLIEYIRRRASQAAPSVAPSAAPSVASGAARRAATRAGQGQELRLGIGDDCAILQPRPREEIVVTTDFCLESRHFRRDWHSPQSVGHRTLARGLSDLAAMGARPVAAFLSLALPRSAAVDKLWVEGFFDGLLSLAKRAAVPLAGGDTAEAPGRYILADIVVLGAVRAGKALRRDGARPGDRLFCTGALGGAAAELQRLARPRSGKSDEALGHPQLFPEPRLAVGQMLRERGLATAAIDISDGLSTDLHHLCAASGVRAEIHQVKLPLHALALLAGTRGRPERPLLLALHGGEDYELLFTVREGAFAPRRFRGVALTEIGCIKRRGRGRPTVTLVDANGQPRELPAAGWEHLR